MYKRQKEFRARGAEMAVTITSTADKEVTVILAEAQKKSEIMKVKEMVKEIIFLLQRSDKIQNSLHFIELCRLMKKL